MKRIFITGILAMLALSTVTAIAQNSLTAAERNTIAGFEKGIKEYEKVRSKALKTVPDISKDATPEQITVYKTALRTAVQNARPNAKQGDIFTPEAQTLIRSMIKAEFKGWERNALRKKVLEADTK